MHRLLSVVFVLLAIAWIPAFECSKKPSAAARREDIPYIKCQVCLKVAAQLNHLVKKKQAAISPKKISEYQIIEIAENVCNVKKEEADWILHMDILEEGDTLEVVEQNTEGHCNSKCKTIERACQEIMGYSDTDVAEYLYSKQNSGNLIRYLCKDLTKSCSAKPPPVPKDRTPGEPFVAKSFKEVEMDKMMRSMQGMPGAPGMKMYSRDELMNTKNFGGENEDEDEDEDEDDNFPSNLGKVLREKESKGDWKNKITKGVSKAGEAIKKHAYKVSNKVRNWWRSKFGGLKTSKPTEQEL